MKWLTVFSSLMFTVTLFCLGQSSQRANSASTHGNGAIVGHLEIPRLHISVVVLEGATPDILAVAAGHIEGTSLPGPPEIWGSRLTAIRSSDR